MGFLNVGGWDFRYLEILYFIYLDISFRIMFLECDWIVCIVF